MDWDTIQVILRWLNYIVFAEVRVMVKDFLMDYAPFKYINSFYMEYASWLEEFHAQDYIDQLSDYVAQ